MIKLRLTIKDREVIFLKKKFFFCLVVQMLLINFIKQNYETTIFNIG